MPYELRPFPTETLKPEGDYLQTTWKNHVYPMAEHYGVKIILPSVSPQPYTHLAFEGYQFAKENGKGNEYNHRMFTAFFQEELNIGNVDVLTKLAGEIGLNEQSYKTALDTGTYKEVHKQALQQANEINIQAVPTFFIGETELRGVISKKALVDVINQELSKQRRDSNFGGLLCGQDGC